MRRERSKLQSLSLTTMPKTHVLEADDIEYSNFKKMSEMRTSPYKPYPEIDYHKCPSRVRRSLWEIVKIYEKEDTVLSFNRYVSAAASDIKTIVQDFKKMMYKTKYKDIYAASFFKKIDSDSREDIPDQIIGIRFEIYYADCGIESINPEMRLYFDHGAGYLSSSSIDTPSIIVPIMRDEMTRETGAMTMKMDALCIELTHELTHAIDKAVGQYQDPGDEYKDMLSDLYAIVTSNELRAVYHFAYSEKRVLENEVLELADIDSTCSMLYHFLVPSEINAYATTFSEIMRMNSSHFKGKRYHNDLELLSDLISLDTSYRDVVEFYYNMVELIKNPAEITVQLHNMSSLETLILFTRLLYYYEIPNPVMRVIGRLNELLSMFGCKTIRRDQIPSLEGFDIPDDDGQIESLAHEKLEKIKEICKQTIHYLYEVVIFGHFEILFNRLKNTAMYLGAYIENDLVEILKMQYATVCKSKVPERYVNPLNENVLSYGWYVAF